MHSNGELRLELNDLAAGYGARRVLAGLTLTLHGGETLVVAQDNGMRRRAAFAFQFHSELTHQMMCRWTTRGHARLELPNARPRAEHFDGRLVHDSKTRLWLEKFLDLWTGLAKKERHQAADFSQNAKGVADCEPTLP